MPALLSPVDQTELGFDLEGTSNDVLQNLFRLRLSIQPEQMHPGRGIQLKPSPSLARVPTDTPPAKVPSIADLMTATVTASIFLRTEVRITEE